MTRMMPVGIEDYAKIRQGNYYYVDKTGLIADLMDRRAEVTLFTRPRRFGKSLTMSMLRYYYEIGTDPALFEGLRIMERPDLCAAHMGQYPVIFLSLKSVEGLTYEDAWNRLRSLVQREVRRHSGLKTSGRLSKENMATLQQLLQGDDEILSDSLLLLSELLYKHYGRKTILLIDEYDVPLDKAFQNGYYREMVSLIRGFLGQALKTNPFLEMGVLTGCLRISRESIFTGLNNFKVLSIADARFDEYFGFTEEEVQRLLGEYGLEDRLDEMREWYDGYHIGDANVYCPWDVINHVDLLLDKPNARPQAYWINTSGNALVKRFVYQADKETQNEIERLIAGETIDKEIRLELTYDEIDDSINNLWSVLYTTGYLTSVGEPDGNRYCLVIPNEEVRQVYIDQIRKWFGETILRDYEPLRILSQAFLDGDAETIERQLTMILGKTISIQDTRARKGQKENFYHGFLLGLLRSNPQWGMRSNAEAGDGFSDIIVEPEDPDAGIIIELKYAPTFQSLNTACAAAMEQIKDRNYAEALQNDGRVNILTYGIAFHKKRCRVAVERL